MSSPLAARMGRRAKMIARPSAVHVKPPNQSFAPNRSNSRIVPSGDQTFSATSGLGPIGGTPASRRLEETPKAPVVRMEDEQRPLAATRHVDPEEAFADSNHEVVLVAHLERLEPGLPP